MRIALVLAGSLLLGSVAAQDPADPKPTKPSAATKVTAADRMQELHALQREAIAEWRESRKAAQEAAKHPTEGKAIKAVSMRPDFSGVAVKALQFAREFAGTGDAVQFLMMVVQASSDQDAKRECIEVMLKSHLDSPELAQMGPMLNYLEGMIDAEFAAKVKAGMLKSKNADVRGWAVLAMHQGTVEDADLASAEYGTAKKALLAAAAAADSKDLAGEIRGMIDMREKFGPGCEAPDIVGIDLEGVEFKLSDYKGKVIFLDFWGDW